MLGILQTTGLPASSTPLSEVGVSPFSLYFFFKGVSYYYSAFNNDQAQGHRLQDATAGTDFDPALPDKCCCVYCKLKSFILKGTFRI